MNERKKGREEGRKKRRNNERKKGWKNGRKEERENEQEKYIQKMRRR